MSKSTLTLSFGRTLAIVSVVGGVALAGPASVALADPSPVAKLSRASATDKGETVEQRIVSLHKRLGVTSAEEPSWGPVAQAMRDNAASMEKLVAAKRAQLPQDMTALDDLKTYQEFAQAHVDGLKNLTMAFETLYSAMPDDQKKKADKVFQQFGHEQGRSHG